MIKKRYHTVRTIPKSKWKFDNPKTVSVIVDHITNHNVNRCYILTPLPGKMTIY